MKARPAVVCPACGALNRQTWEYCVRCNESLAGAEPAEEGTGPAEPAEEEPGASPLPARLLAAATVLGIVALGAWAWRSSSAASSAAVDPALFTIATRPPALPVAPAEPKGPGAADFEEGRRLLAAGDVAGATARFAAAVAAEPENTAYRGSYADALWKSDDRDAALDQLAEAARLDPQLHARYARALDAGGRTADAVREYEAILSAHPEAGVVREELGRLLYRSGDYAKAAPHLQEAVQNRPTDAVLRQELAYALEKSGQRAQAATVYREVLRQAPGAVATRALLSENLVEQGRRDEALAVLREGLQTSPDMPLLQRQLGSVLERSGRSAEAAAAYRAYARLAPNAPDARDLAARAARLESAGRWP